MRAPEAWRRGGSLSAYKAFRPMLPRMCARRRSAGWSEIWRKCWLSGYGGFPQLPDPEVCGHPTARFWETAARAGKKNRGRRNALAAPPLPGIEKSPLRPAVGAHDGAIAVKHALTHRTTALEGLDVPMNQFFPRSRRPAP